MIRLLLPIENYFEIWPRRNFKYVVIQKILYGDITQGNTKIYKMLVYEDAIDENDLQKLKFL